MRKLKLDVDALEVESFVPQSHAAEGGTVHGQRGPYNQDWGSTVCDGPAFSLFGTCINCPTVGTCIGPTYCCPPSWRPTCSCLPEECGT
jgi:hypothetical protein